MNKSYISPTKLACLAICSLIPTIGYGFNALIMSICVAASFVLGIAIVSFFEKITNSHVRFMIYAIIVAGTLTILKLVFGYVGSLKFTQIATQLDWGLLASLVLGIYPIYYLHKTTSKTYFLSTIITALTFMLFLILTGIVIEFLAFGSFFEMFYTKYSFDFLGSSFMIYLLLSIFCVSGVGIELYITNKRREERLLIDKYKYMIRESQIEKLKKQNDTAKTNVFVVGGDNNES